MQKKSCYFKLLSVLVLTFFLSACTEEAPQEARQMPPSPVVAIEVKPLTFSLTNEYMGKALGFLSVEVRAQVPGILLKKYYREGDFVTKGQLLFEIDPSQAQAAFNQASAGLAQANSALKNAQREWQRIIPLYQKNAVSQRDRDQAESAYLSAKANVAAAEAAKNQAEINLGYTKVVAPISGYTSLEARNEGNLISLDAVGSLLTTINQTDPMYITFSFPASDMARLANLAQQGKAEVPMEGSETSLVLLSGLDYSEKGKLSFIDTQINPLTNAIEARAEFPNPRGVLIPNMFSSITVDGGTLKEVIILPQSAVLYTADGTMVYVIDNENKAQLRPIELGFTINSYFIINGGIQAGDKVVTKGISKIFPGAPVAPTIKELSRPNAQADKKGESIEGVETTEAQEKKATENQALEDGTVADTKEMERSPEEAKLEEENAQASQNNGESKSE